MNLLPALKELERSVIMGEPIVAGYAIGKVVRDYGALPGKFKARTLHEDEVEEELTRIREAIDAACHDLSLLRSKVSGKIDPRHAEIFTAQQMILKDSELYKEIEGDLRRRRLNAEQVVQDVFLCWEEKLRNVGEPLIQEKADDMADLGRRLVDALTGVQDGPAPLIADAVLCARRLLPSDMVSLDSTNINAIVTAEGTQNAHSAILARALDIPFVSKIDVDAPALSAGSVVIVDGGIGEVIVNPRPDELETYAQLIRNRGAHRVKMAQWVKNVPLELEGRPIKVRANASSLSELKMARAFGADGIGLYRTESFYMGKTDFPSEEDFYAQLRDSLETVRGQDITLRLLDIGGDKTLPFWDLGEIKNPALGLNGVRLLLKYPRLLEMQLRVFLRLSAEFDVKALVPMVSLPKDMAEVRRYLLQEKNKLRRQGVPFNENILLGAMIETPAALLAIDQLLELSDFFNIGTNDLVQYIMAAGRGREDVADYYQAGNRLVLPMLKEAISKAEARGRPCRLCGELAGNLGFTQELLAIGLRNFSVQPALVPFVKDNILRLSKTKPAQSDT